VFNVFNYLGCYTAESLGPSILPSQFTASSQLREEEAPSMARLGNSRSWIAAKTDTNIWLQVSALVVASSKGFHLGVF
jgi:hypothetical protein